MSPRARPLIRRLLLELRTLLAPGPRSFNEMECVLSVGLAILLAHGLGVRNVSWAAFSGYLVMRSQLSESFVRGALRVAGTGVGGALALVVVPVVISSTLMSSASAGLIGGLALYGALTRKRAYAWLLVGITFEMVLHDAAEHPAGSVAAFATPTGRGGGRNAGLPDRQAGLTGEHWPSMACKFGPRPSAAVSPASPRRTSCGAGCAHARPAAVALALGSHSRAFSERGNGHGGDDGPRPGHGRSRFGRR